MVKETLSGSLHSAPKILSSDTCSWRSGRDDRVRGFSRKMEYQVGGRFLIEKVSLRRLFCIPRRSLIAPQQADALQHLAVAWITANTIVDRADGQVAH